MMHFQESNLECAQDRLPLRNWRRWFSYEVHIWLVYVGFWYIQPYYDHAPLRQWLWLGGVTVLFILIFTFAHRGPRNLRWLAALAMLVLGLVYVPLNQSACGIFIFLAVCIAEIAEKPNVVVSLLIGEALIVTTECTLLHLSAWVWSVSVGIGLLIGMNRLRMNQKNRTDAKLRMAHDEIERLAKTAERERIARDMHDVLGHSLSLIVLKSELAGHLIGSQPARAALEIREIEDTARGALAEVRRTLTGYRSEGFHAELTKAAKVLEAAGIQLRSPDKPPILNARHEATLSMVLREAVTNIVRHAKASECSIELSSADATTNMVIADNGRGNIREEGNGLRGMRERVQELGGRLLLESSRGTRLQIELPQLDARALAPRPFPSKTSRSSPTIRMTSSASCRPWQRQQAGRPGKLSSRSTDSRTHRACLPKTRSRLSASTPIFFLPSMSGRLTRVDASRSTRSRGPTGYTALLSLTQVTAG